jgi:hypothetical protein
LCYEWNIKHTPKAEDYRNDINAGLNALHNREDAWQFCYHRMKTYNQMVCSIKPLKLKYWVSKDIIDKLMDIDPNLEPDPEITL